MPPPRLNLRRIAALAASAVLTGVALFFLAPLWRFHRSLTAAEAALAGYEFADARRHLDDCLRLRPRHARTRLLAVQAARRDGELDKARVHLDAYHDLVESSPEATLEYAMLAAQRGEMNDVHDYLVAQLGPDSPTAEQALEALAMGGVLVYRLDQAAGWILELLRRFPSNPIGRVLKGQTLQTEGKDSEAIEEFRTVIAAHPRHVIARRHLAALLIRTHSHREAADHFRELVRQQPGEVGPLLGLLHCLRMMNELEEARQLLERLESEFPNVPVARRECGRAAAQDGRIATAIDLLRDAVRLSPSDPEAHYQLALALRKAAKTAEAERHSRRFQEITADLLALEKAVEEMKKSANDPVPRVEAARICLRNGQPDEALRWLNGALQIDPRHGPAHDELARYFEEKGDTEQAAKHRRRGR